jgi:hypothetical protein
VGGYSECRRPQPGICATECCSIERSIQERKNDPCVDCLDVAFRPQLDKHTDTRDHWTTSLASQAKLANGHQF